MSDLLPKDASGGIVDDDFFEIAARERTGLTFDDVRLRSDYTELSPEDVSVAGRFSRRIPLKTPIVSAAMDTVTEHAMAIAIACAGGIGVIHRNLSPEAQADEIDRVKYYLNARIEKPICIKNTEQTLANVIAWRKEKEYSFTSFPVIDAEGRLIGLLTGDHFECYDSAQMVAEVMEREICTAGEKTTVEEAYRILTEQRMKILPLVSSADRKLVGIYIRSDLKRIMSGEGAHNTDANGNLRVAAAVGVGKSAIERAERLVAKKVDALVIDTAHAYTKSVIETLRELKRHFPDTDVVVGNISEEDAAYTLAEEGADGIKVGQGVGSICTTATVTGVGRAQLSAIYWSARGARKRGVPVCADGAIRFSSDMTLAFAAGAESVMLGNLLARTEESPGRIVVIGGTRMKMYRGMGSVGAIRGNVDRYLQGGKLTGGMVVAEGVEAAVPLKGSVVLTVQEYIEGLRRGMSSVGAGNIRTLQEQARFERLTSSAITELRPHDVTVIEEAFISPE